MKMNWVRYMKLFHPIIDLFSLSGLVQINDSFCLILCNISWATSQHNETIIANDILLTFYDLRSYP